jgi:hypothetical protein
MWNITAIKHANKTAGKHYFEPGTMQFFDSRVLSYVYQGPGGVYFVTSEQFHGSTGSKPRAFTVRRFNPETAAIDTFGPFNELTRERAQRIARIAAHSKNLLTKHV